MQSGVIREFLLSLGVRKDSIRETDDFVNSSCPLAFFTHKRHEDRRPSFGVKVDPHSSYYYCFTCSPWPAKLDVLIHNYWLMYGKYPYEAARFLIDESQDIPEITIDEKWTKRKIVDPLPKYVVNQFPLLQYGHDSRAIQCRRYLERRGIPEWVYNYCGVRYDKKYGFLVIPLTDASGRIFMLRARAINQKRVWTIDPQFLGLSYSFPRLSDVGVLFGSHLVDRTLPLMIVEGEIDLMRLYALGYFNVVASCTSAITAAQMSAISSSVVILGMDADSSGRLAHRRIAKELREKSLLYLADWSRINKKDSGELVNCEELNKVLAEMRIIT